MFPQVFLFIIDGLLKSLAGVKFLFVIEAENQFVKADRKNFPCRYFQVSIFKSYLSF